MVICLEKFPSQSTLPKQPQLVKVRVLEESQTGGLTTQKLSNACSNHSVCFPFFLNLVFTNLLKLGEGLALASQSHVNVYLCTSNSWNQIAKGNTFLFPSSVTTIVPTLTHICFH
uniref:Uncharacterized protein n=1 Tax=Pyxicephalus adspersus TaxID=30357 RepID=A0AAV2ZYP9_PYXAD|nr:TPA: hypothetical protein GDO54_004355 [Pyxicephalus adspersus]